MTTLLRDAPKRPCAGNCGALVTRGRCPSCQRANEERRGTAAERGYGSAWQAFRPRYIGMLVALGISPVCGATLPDGPSVSHSRCKADGRLTFTSQDGSSLHLNHEPPLRDDERLRVSAVCDPMRIELLCDGCHNAETAAQRDRGGL